MRESPVTHLLLALAACILLACSPSVESQNEASQPTAIAPEQPTTPGDNEVVQATNPAAKNAVVPASTKSAPRSPQERPLPGFDGATIDGKRISIASYIGKRFLIFAFNPEVEDSSFVADAMRNIAAFQGKHNFKVVGVATGSSLSKARRFAKEKQLDFPIFDDSSARIARRLGLRQPTALYGIDADGYLAWGIGSFIADVADPAAVVEEQLRERMRIPEKRAATRGALDQRPFAPPFTVTGADGNEFSFADHAGQPLVLVFFLHTCPHCHSALAFLHKQLEAIPEAKRPLLISVSAQNRPTAVRVALKEEGLDYFPVYYDPEYEVMEQFNVFGGFPDILMIDAEGRIVHRTRGWEQHRDPALNRMVLARISGEKVPMLLNPKGYTGSDVCGVCHEREAMSYDFTQHATAFDSLVTHNEDRKGECVSCHVVGFDQPGGYSFKEMPRYLENVGCESCHGRGGPHLSPGFITAGSFEDTCKTCHNPTHSLGFDYAEFRPKISHVAIAALSDAERAAMLEASGKPRDVLPDKAAYVGSAACRDCHESEHATWSKSPHGNAMKSLVAENKAGDSNCLACHTTAFGRKGGFHSGASGTDPAHPDLANVGCESCHGPGGDHIALDARKLGSIVSLGDKCDSCVILQICGRCHDDANDPGFEFEVQEKIDRQRHGTLEAGTGKPLDTSARLDLPALSAEAEAARVFGLLDRPG